MTSVAQHNEAIFRISKNSWGTIKTIDESLYTEPSMTANEMDILASPELMAQIEQAESDAAAGNQEAFMDLDEMFKRYGPH